MSEELIVKNETKESPLEISANLNNMHIDKEDIDLPRLNIMQKTSDMDFEVGSLVIDKMHEITQRDIKIDCVVLSAAKMWRENIPFEVEEMPEIRYTKEEARALEIESQYGVIEFAEITLLFPEPEGDSNPEVYDFPIADKRYAMGRINVQKDGYKNTYKRLTRFALFNPTTPINSRVWQFETQLMTRGKHSWFIPTLTATEEHVEEPVGDFANTFSL
jgi:hypothetical protein